MYKKIIFALLIGLSTQSIYCGYDGLSIGGVNPRKALHGEHRAKRAVGLRFNNTARQQEKTKEELKNARAARAKNRRALQKHNRSVAPAVKDYSTEYETTSAFAHAAHSYTAATSHHDSASSSDTPRLRAPRANPSCLATTGYVIATVAIAAITSPYAQKALEAFAAEMLELKNSTN